MTSIDTSKTQIAYARLAGLMYLLVILIYLVGDHIVSPMLVDDNFAETARRIAASPHLYRFGLSADLIEQLCTVLLAAGLYVAVKPFDANLALLAFGFRMMEIIIGGSAISHRFAAMQLRTGDSYAKAFDANQLSALVTSQSDSRSASWHVAAISFGVGSTIFFYLFVRSLYIPRPLSVFGLFASVLVTLGCYADLIYPEYGDVLANAWTPISIAEVTTGLWLLFKGVKVQPRTSESFSTPAV